MTKHSRDARGVEAIRLVTGDECQPRAWIRCDREGIVCLFDRTSVGDLEKILLAQRRKGAKRCRVSRGLCLRLCAFAGKISFRKRRVDGIVLEDEDAFEERAAARHVAPLL